MYTYMYMCIHICIYTHVYIDVYIYIYIARERERDHGNYHRRLYPNIKRHVAEMYKENKNKQLIVMSRLKYHNN